MGRMEGQLDAWAARDALGINALTYAELSIAHARIEDLEDTVDRAELGLLDMPREALFLAGKVVLAYRKQGAIITGVLPYFLHWRACGSDGAAAADARDGALPYLLSRGCPDRTGCLSHSAARDALNSPVFSKVRIND